MSIPTATVTGFLEGFSNSTLRMPYVLAQLSCGHVAKVVLRPTRGICCGCGATLTAPEGRFERCACGTWHASHIDSPKPHLAADRITQVGDVVACSDCAMAQQQEAWLRELDVPVHHARLRHGSYCLYRLDHTSPSNFFLIGCVPPTPAIEALLRAKGISPLSPTEPA